MNSPVPSLLLWARGLLNKSNNAELERLEGLTIVTLISSKNNLTALYALLRRVPIEQRLSIIDHPDEYGNTAMHYFALFGNRDALGCLSKLGASSTVANNANETSYDVCINGSLECVTYDAV
jgi:ankyrin repeat protein